MQTNTNKVKTIKPMRFADSKQQGNKRNKTVKHDKRQQWQAM